MWEKMIAVTSFLAAGGQVALAEPTGAGSGAVQLDAFRDLGAFAVAVAIGWYFLGRSDRREREMSAAASERERDQYERLAAERDSIAAERDEYRRRYIDLLAKIADAAEVAGPAEYRERR